MSHTNRSPLPAFLRRNAAGLALTLGIFVLTYTIVIRFSTGNSEYIADYLAHGVWAIGLTPQRMIASFYDGSQRLWHICVKLIYSLNHNIWGAAGIVTAAANAAAYFLFFKIFDQALPEKLPRWLLALLTAVVFVAAPLWVPGARHYIGASNTWHNPTNLMVRPFALASFYMTVRIYNRRRYGRDSIAILPETGGEPFAFRGGFRRQFREPVYKGAEVVLYPLCLLFSTYAKPSFLQFFAPAILVFLLIDVVRTRGMLLPFCLKLALAFLPAAFIVFSQFFAFFDGNLGSAASAVASTSTADLEAASSGIVVYFVDTDFWNDLWYWVLNILRMSAFPLFILCLTPRRSWGDTAARLGFLGAAAGRLEAMFLHETGSRASHGNLLWGQYLSLWILWGIAMQRFALLFREKSAAGKLARWVGTPLMAWHLLSGIAYCVLCIQTGNYHT